MINNRPNVPRSRMRLRFARRNEAMVLTQLQQIKALRKIVLNSGLPVVLTGRSGIPKIAFGPAISLGYESLCEYADLYLAVYVSEKDVFSKIASVLPSFAPQPEADGALKGPSPAESLLSEADLSSSVPPPNADGTSKGPGPAKLLLSEADLSVGFELLDVKKIPIHFPSVESLVNVSEYIISGDMALRCSREKIAAFVAGETINVVKNKPGGEKETINLKPLIIEFEPFQKGVRLLLRFGPKKNIKPEIVVSLCSGMDNAGVCNPESGLSVIRKALYWEDVSGKFFVP